jgi:hypothetical protein
MAVSAPKQKFETAARGSADAGTDKDLANGGLKKAEGFERINVRQTHPTPRKYLELTQDVIVFCLCALLLVTMGIKLSHLGWLLIDGTDFSLVVGDILFILVLMEFIFAEKIEDVLNAAIPQLGEHFAPRRASM